MRRRRLSIVEKKKMGGKGYSIGPSKSNESTREREREIHTALSPSPASRSTAEQPPFMPPRFLESQYNKYHHYTISLEFAILNASPVKDTSSGTQR